MSDKVNIAAYRGTPGVLEITIHEDRGVFSYAMSAPNGVVQITSRSQAHKVKTDHVDLCEGIWRFYFPEGEEIGS